MTIAAQLDPFYIGKTCYARIRNPANTGYVWNVQADAFELESSVVVGNMDVVGTVSATGYFTATEPAAFSATLIAPATIHHQEGGVPAATDPTVAITTTHVELEIASNVLAASIATLTTPRNITIELSD